MLQDTLHLEFSQQSSPVQQHAITLGYYKLRGKAQVPRLLCQLLKIDYKDQLFTLADWDRFKKTKCKKWDFPDLPFVMEGDFVVTQPTPICIYLVKRFGNSDLLGKSAQDKALMNSYLWTIETMGNIININCQKLTQEELQELKNRQWKNNVAPRLSKYQQIAKQNDWFLGYFTLIDLSLYELVRYMNLIFPGQMANFPKLSEIQKRVYQLPEIKEYQESARAVKETDPTTLLEELKNMKVQYVKN